MYCGALFLVGYTGGQISQGADRGILKEVVVVLLVALASSSIVVVRNHR